MIEAKLTTTEDISLDLKIPENLGEMSLNCKLAFDVCREDIALWLKECVDNEVLFENRNYYLYLVSRAISEALDVDIIEILDLDCSMLVDDEGELLPSVLASHLKDESKDVDIDSLEANILTLYNLIEQVVDDYSFEFRNSENFTFTYKKEEYEIPYVKTVLFTGEKQFSKVSTAQAVEIMQVKKFLGEEGKKNTEKDKDGVVIEKARPSEDSQAEMNLRFTGFLKIISCLAMKKGEKIPLEDSEFSAFVTKKMAHFQNLDAQVGMDIGFFLTIFTKNSAK